MVLPFGGWMQGKGKEKGVCVVASGAFLSLSSEETRAIQNASCVGFKIYLCSRVKGGKSVGYV
jgi:hypothetical protein